MLGYVYCACIWGCICRERGLTCLFVHTPGCFADADDEVILDGPGTGLESGSLQSLDSVVRCVREALSTLRIYTHVFD